MSGRWERYFSSDDVEGVPPQYSIKMLMKLIEDQIKGLTVKGKDMMIPEYTVK